MALTVLITFASNPSPDYPLAVVVLDDTPGSRVPRSQDYQVRSVRDGRVFGNGMCAAARIAGADWPINPVVDPRLVEV